jgi:hypothetical protein
MLILAQAQSQGWKDLLPLLGAVGAIAAYIGAIRLWYHKVRMECVDGMTKDLDECTESAAQWTRFTKTWETLAGQAESMTTSANTAKTKLEAIKPETDETRAAVVATGDAARRADEISTTATKVAAAPAPKSHLKSRMKTAVWWIRGLSLLDVAILFTAVVLFKHAFRPWLPYANGQWNWNSHARFDPFALAVQVVLLVIVGVCGAHVWGGCAAWAMGTEFKKKGHTSIAVAFGLIAGALLLAALLLV